MFELYEEIVERDDLAPRRCVSSIWRPSGGGGVALSNRRSAPGARACFADKRAVQARFLVIVSDTCVKCTPRGVQVV